MLQAAEIYAATLQRQTTIQSQYLEPADQLTRSLYKHALLDTGMRFGGIYFSVITLAGRLSLHNAYYKHRGRPEKVL
jgi:hypothetical protein